MTDQILEGRRFLVVEDEMLVLMVLEDMLDELGCRSITAAANVEDALKLAATEDYDAAVLDVNLNGSKSYPVADALAQRGIPFAFSTGYANHGAGTAFGNRPVLRKPYQLHNLTAICDSWFAEPSEAAG